MFAQPCLMMGSREKPAAGDNAVSMPVVQLCSLPHLCAHHVRAMHMNPQPSSLKQLGHESYVFLAA